MAVSAEAIHKKWDLNAYALIPIGKYGLGSDNVANLNSLAGASPLTTFGLKVAYAISDKWQLGAGYYYEFDEKSDPYYPESVDGSGVQASLSFDINNQLEAGVLYSYDDYFESRVSGNLIWRFNGSKATAETSKSPVLQGLVDKPDNRNVRVANSSRFVSCHPDIATYNCPSTVPTVSAVSYIDARAFYYPLPINLKATYD